MDIDEIEVFQHQSPSESEDYASGDDELTTPKIIRKWIYKETFALAAEADEFIKQEKCWSALRKYETVAGKKVEYRCNLVKRRSKRQCNASIYLLYHADDLTVSRFACELDHNHDELNEGKKSLASILQPKKL
mgnify:FL=1